jgi:hypothetical protein
LGPGPYRHTPCRWSAGSHLTKTSTRAVANASPEPISNWFLSFGEDLFVVGLGFLALRHPVVALVVAAALIALIVVFAATIIRTVRRWFSRTTLESRASNLPTQNR